MNTTDFQFKSIFDDDDNFYTDEILSIYEYMTMHLLFGDNQTSETLLNEAILSLNKESALKFIDYLDYVTSNHSQYFIQLIDNQQFIKNFFMTIKQYKLANASGLLLSWRDKVKTTSILIRDLLFDLALDEEEISNKLKERPKLNYIKSTNLEIQALYEQYLTLRLELSTPLNLKKQFKISQDKSSQITSLINEIKNLKQKQTDTSSDDYDCLYRLYTQVHSLKYFAKAEEKEETTNEINNFIESQTPQKEIKQTKQNMPSKESKKDGKKEKKDQNDSKTAKDNAITQVNIASNPKTNELPVVTNTPANDKNKSSTNQNIQANAQATNSNSNGTYQFMTLEELLEYKCEPCPNENCLFKPTKLKVEKFKNKDFQCKYYHFAYDKRREIIIADGKFNYHAKACDKNPCKFKNKCYFSHNFFESYYHPLYYKKFSCQQNIGEVCDKSKYCPYIHTKEEELKWDNILRSKINIDRSLNKDNITGTYVNIKGNNSSDDFKQAPENDSSDEIEKPPRDKKKGKNGGGGDKVDDKVEKKDKEDKSKCQKNLKKRDIANGTGTTVSSSSAKTIPTKKKYEASPDNTMPILDGNTLINLQIFMEGQKFNLQNEFNIYTTNKIEKLQEQKYKTITEAICAFLNGDGGYIFIGIHKNGEVSGCNLTFEEQDRLRNNIINVIQKFSPKPAANLYKIEIYPIKNHLNNIISNFVIVRIKVEKGDPDKVYSNEFGDYYYFAGKKTKKYTPQESRELIIQRATKKQIQIPNNNTTNSNNEPIPQNNNSNNNANNLVTNQLYSSNLGNQYPVQNHLPVPMAYSIGQIPTNQPFPMYAQNQMMGYTNPNMMTNINPTATNIQQNIPYSQYPQSIPMGQIPNVMQTNTNQYYPGINPTQPNNGFNLSSKEYKNGNNKFNQPTLGPLSNSASSPNFPNFIPSQPQSQIAYPPNLVYNHYTQMTPPINPTQMPLNNQQNFTGPSMQSQNQSYSQGQQYPQNIWQTQQ